MNKDQFDVSTAVQLKHVFGLRTDVSQCLHYVDENLVAFVGGHNVVLHHTEDKSQSFIAGINHGANLTTNGITAIDVFLPKRLIAVAEKTEKNPIIQIFELIGNDKRKRKKLIHVTEIQSRDIISLKFSQDGKYLLAVSGSPDWAIINFQRDKGKVIQMVKNQTTSTMPFYHASFCPADHNLIVCTGHKVLKFFRCEQTELKPIQASLGAKREPQDYTSHAWDNDRRLLVATDNAEVLVFDGTEFRGVFDTQIPNPLFSIATFSKGFIAGCEHGILLVFERGDDKEMYKKINKLTVQSGNFNNQNANSDSGATGSMSHKKNYLDASNVSANIDDTTNGNSIENLSGNNENISNNGTNNSSNAHLLGNNSTPNSKHGGYKDSFSGMGHGNDSHSHGGKGKAIIHISVPPSEESLACVLANNQAYTLNLSQIEVLKENDPNDPNFHLLSTPFHHRGITGMDLCIRKPYIATCSHDQSVRIWNWNDKTQVICKKFNQDPLCISMHPSGLHVIVGFSDKLRLMNILMDDLRTYKDFSIKACCEAKFSNGGQYFAAVNASVVQIYSTYTFTNVATLRGHTAKVSSIWWSNDDSSLVTASVDNTIIEWNIANTASGGGVASSGGQNNARKQDHQHKGCAYTSALVMDSSDSSSSTSALPPASSGSNHGSSIAHSGGGNSGSSTFTNVMFGVGSDETLKVIMSGSLKRVVDLPLPMQNIEINRLPPQNWIFGGTNAGILSLFGINTLLKTNSNILYHEIQAHSNAITRLRVSHDDTMLVTVGEDGCICIFDISKKDNAILDSNSHKLTGSGTLHAQLTDGKKKADSLMTAQLSWAEEILVTKTDLYSKLNEISSLNQKVEDLRLHNEFEIRMKEMNYQEKLHEVNQKFQQELDNDRAKYDALRTERDDMQKKYELMLEHLSNKHNENLNEVEEYHKNKITNEKQRYQLLVNKLENLRKEWDLNKSKRTIQFKNELDGVEKNYQQKINDEKTNINTITNEIDSIRVEFNEIKILLEKDADHEILKLKEYYDNILKIERTQTLELRGNNGMLKREFAGLQQRIKNGNDKMQRSLEEQNKLINEIKRLEKDIDGYERELNERDSTIKEKNKMINEVEKKNQELEKFKFVLDYKIHELDRQIKPRERTIDVIGKQINEMKFEVSRYHKENKLLNLQCKDLKLKLKALLSELHIIRDNNKLVNDLIASIGNELNKIFKSADDSKKLKESIKKLHRMFENVNFNNIMNTLNDDSQKNANEKSTTNEKAVGLPMLSESADTNIHTEFQRHRNYLEKTVQSLQKKLVKDAAMHKKDSTRIMQENVALIKEINELRREITVAKRTKKEDEDQKKAEKNVSDDVEHLSTEGIHQKVVENNQLIKDCRRKLKFLKSYDKRINNSDTKP